MSLATKRVEPADLRHALREATAADHAALDDRFAAMGWGTPDAYHGFVRMNDACHRTLEPWLAPILSGAADTSRTPFAPSLARDIDAMSLAPLPAPAVPFAAAAGLAEAAGVVYVLDGSRLGARMIARQLRAHPLPNPFSTHYLDAAAVPGPVFAAFDRLARQLGERDIARAVDAARQTFALFGTMSEYAVRR